MEKDAVDENMLYRRRLKKIDDELVSSNISAMKFLCRDFIAGARLERVSRGIDLFVLLEQKQLLGSCDSALLMTMLETVGRCDLARLLDPCTAPSADQLTPYRLVLFRVCDDLTSKEVAMMKFVCEGSMKKRLTNVDTCEDLFVALEENGLLAADRTKLLLDLLSDIHREDLHQLFIPLQQPQSNSPQCRPILGIGASNQGAPGQNPRSFQAVQELSSQLHDVDIKKGNHPTPPANLHLRTCQLQSPVEDTSGTPVTPSTGHQAHLRPPTVSSNISLDFYDMSADPRGICLIIDNEYFTCTAPRSPHLNQRKGTRVDCGKLKDVFEMLRFDVSVQLDQTSSEMEALMTYFSTQVDHAVYNCFVCFILTHGKLGKVYGSDGATVDIMRLTSCFKGDTCPSLVGKPKLFFIQACQGTDKQTGTQIETDAPVDISQALQETIPNEADFLVGFATVPGFVSYRSTTDGTWYIRKLVDILWALHTTEHLLDILIKVNDEVCKAAKETDARVYKQTPAPLVSLRKKIYFR